ncbi:hypothetical protein INR49_005348 [Caranx melampygus]|nr:hypothetical protein INR49_005348 [Caranx melampygus]
MEVQAWIVDNHRTYQYAWANDDISALTASNLLKKYAEKYSGILEGPNERALLCSYSDSTTGLMNGRNNCGSHTATTLHTGLPSQEYTASYNASYLHSSYSSQNTPALPSPHPSPLHSAGLLQPPPPPPPPALVPSYNTGSPNLPNYNYPPTGYPSQTAVGPAPTPIPPSTLPGYTYQSHNHTPIAPTPLNGSTSNSLKRKAFYMSGHGDMDSSYGNFNYTQQRSSQSPMYRITDSGVSDSNRGNGFERNAEASSLAFKPTKQPMSSDQQRKFNMHSGRALTPPSYGSTKSSVGDLRTEPFSKFGSPIMNEQSEEHRQHLSHSLTGPDLGTATSSIHAAEEQLKNSDSNLVEMVTTEILQQGPPVDWSDIAGLEMAKAAIKRRYYGPF